MIAIKLMLVRGGRKKARQKRTGNEHYDIGGNNPLSQHGILG